MKLGLLLLLTGLSVPAFAQDMSFQETYTNARLMEFLQNNRGDYKESENTKLEARNDSDFEKVS